MSSSPHYRFRLEQTATPVNKPRILCWKHTTALNSEQSISANSGSRWRVEVILTLVVFACGTVQAAAYLSTLYILTLVCVALAIGLLFSFEKKGAKCWLLALISVSAVAASAWRSAPGGINSDGFISEFSARRELQFSALTITARQRKRHGEIVFVGKTANDKQLILVAPDLPWHPAAKLTVGTVIRGTMRLVGQKWLSESDSPFSYAAYLGRRGIVARGSLVSFEVLPPAQDQPRWTKFAVGYYATRSRFVDSLISKFGSSDALSVIIAATMGERDLLSHPIQELFRSLSLSHLLVVSGFHVGVIYIFSFSLTVWLYKRSELLLHAFPANCVAAIVGLLVTAIYVLFVGLAVTTLRALLVLAVAAVGTLIDRQAISYRTLVIAALVVTLVWPMWFVELGPQLTFTALLGLLVARVLFERHQRSRSKTQRTGFRKRLLESFYYSLGAWLFTSPVLLFWLQVLVPLGAPLNTVAVPLFSALCITGGGASLVLYALECPGSTSLLQFVIVLTSALISGLEYLADGINSTVFGYKSLEPDSAKQFAWGFVAVNAVLLPYAVFVSATKFQATTHFPEVRPGKLK